jgi:light-harvesting complex I chlorophyll a/b binding protein 1
MSMPNAVLAEPLSLGQNTISRGTWCGGKTIFLFSLLIGMVLAACFSSVPFTRSKVEEPIIDMFGAQLVSPQTLSCPRPGGLAMSVSAMQDTLRKYGIPPSPLEKFGLTQYAASRDVSMAAQAREEFSKLDAVTQAKLKKLRKDVIVRAASLKPAEMAGVTAPLGFFDPAGLSKGDIAFFRAAELKHGRVCMLAFLGIVVSEKFHPFFDAWNDGAFVTAAQSHFSPTAVQQFWPAFWINMAFHEYLLELNKDPDALPGDFGFDPLGLKPTKPEDLKAMQNKELNNGRLAIFAASGIIAQELVTGKKNLLKQTPQTYKDAFLHQCLFLSGALERSGGPSTLFPLSF